jgi:hypothetical protein
MKKNKLSTYFIFIALITFMAIFTLIVQNSYSKLIGPLEQTRTGNLTKPIDPNLDIDTILQIENREEFQSITSSPDSTPSSPGNL